MGVEVLVAVGALVGGMGVKVSVGNGAGGGGNVSGWTEVSVTRINSEVGVEAGAQALNVKISNVKVRTFFIISSVVSIYFQIVPYACQTLFVIC